MYRIALIALLLGGVGCSSDEPKASWEESFVVQENSFLSGIWGSSPNDIFVVGGNRDYGEINHFDGETWTRQQFDEQEVFVWVHGFSDSDVYAVGLNGSAMHFDGTSWSDWEIPTSEDLWGVWGESPNDMWIVGGSVTSGSPVLIHYDGSSFTPYELPAAENPIGATALFKIWGIGGRTLAVGHRGLVLELENGEWKRILAGEQADDDFVNLGGTSASDIFLVGGRGRAQLATTSSDRFETQKLASVGGLADLLINPCFIQFGTDVGEIVSYDRDTGEVKMEEFLPEPVHAMWDDGNGTIYAVGGLFSAPFTGMAFQISSEEFKCQ